MTFTPVTETRKEAIETAKLHEAAGAGKNREKSKGEYLKNLTQVSSIRYPTKFRKKSVSALFDSGTEVNTIYPNFAKELGFLIKPTDVRAQKIDGTTLVTFGIIVADFSMINKTNQVRFFEEIFLVAYVSPKVVFGMLFLTLSDAEVDFLGRKLR